MSYKNKFINIEKNITKFYFSSALFFSILSVVFWILLLHALKHNDSYPDIVKQKFFIICRSVSIFISIILFTISFLTFKNKNTARKISIFTQNLLILLITAIIGLGLLELTASAIYKQKYVQYELQKIHRVCPVSDVVYDLNPNTEINYFYQDQNEQIRYQTNAMGLRGNDIAEKKDKNTIRILVLGDSVTFGVRVDEQNIYTYKLEQLLNQWAKENNLDKKFEVLNPSASGWNTYNEYEWLKNFGLKYEPDIVLVQLCMNDVDDPLTHLGTTVLYHFKDMPREFFPTDPKENRYSNIFVKKAKDVHLMEVVNLYGSRYSKLYTMLSGYYLTIKINMDAKKSNKPPAVWLSWCLDKLADEKSEEAIWIQRQFKKINELCREKNIPCTVVVFPLSYQLHSDNATYKKAIEMSEKYIKDSGLELFNLTPIFETRTPKDNQFELYLRGDAAHLNKNGHELVAKELLEYLKKDF